MKPLVGFLIILGFSTQSYSLCKEAHIKDMIQIKPGRNIVYFASWCQSCARSIANSDPKQDLYVAVFDKLSPANKALEFVLKDKLKSAKCLWDKSGFIAKAAGVTQLPKTQKHRDTISRLLDFQTSDKDKEDL